MNIQFSGSISIPNLNTSGSTLSFYGADPITQPTAIGTVNEIASLTDVSSTSAAVQANFTTLKNKVNELVDKLNAVNALLSDAEGGNGLTQ